MGEKHSTTWVSVDTSTGTQYPDNLTLNHLHSPLHLLLHSLSLSLSLDSLEERPIPTLSPKLTDSKKRVEYPLNF